MRTVLLLLRFRHINQTGRQVHVDHALGFVDIDNEIFHEGNEHLLALFGFHHNEILRRHLAHFHDFAHIPLGFVFHLKAHDALGGIRGAFLKTFRQIGALDNYVASHKFLGDIEIFHAGKRHKPIVAAGMRCLFYFCLARPIDRGRHEVNAKALR